LDTGAVKLTDACVFPALALTAVAEPGTPAGITLLDAADAMLVPTAFVAVTVNVYAVPLVRPVTMIGLAAPATTTPPGFEVTV
jgi:hypothetical protein